VQTSSKKLATAKETKLYSQLVTLLADIEHPKAMSTFLSVFLSDTERSVLAKRLGILWLLSQGKSYEEIQDELHVSSATISSMSELATKPAIKQALETIKRDERIEKFLKA
jgi:Trp operon repressor